MEAGTPVLVEPTLKYHPGVVEVLTLVRESGSGTVLRRPSYSSVTLWEETAPVKLPTMHCPRPR